MAGPFPELRHALPSSTPSRSDRLLQGRRASCTVSARRAARSTMSPKPTDEAVRSVELGYVSRAAARARGPGRQGGRERRVGYRLNATHEEGNTKRWIAVPRFGVVALDARLSDRLTWDFQSIYQDRKAIGQEPTIYAGTMAGSSCHRRCATTMTGWSGRDRMPRTMRSAITQPALKYQLADEWTLSTNYSYSSTRTRRNESVLFLRDQAGDYDDYRSDYGEAYGYNQWQAMLEGKFATGPLKHHVVAGASAEAEERLQRQRGLSIAGHGQPARAQYQHVLQRRPAATCTARPRSRRRRCSPATRST